MAGWGVGVTGVGGCGFGCPVRGVLSQELASQLTVSEPCEMVTFFKRTIDLLVLTLRKLWGEDGGVCCQEEQRKAFREEEHRGHRK